MPQQPSLNLIPTIQQAISNLLMTHEPEFLRFGHGLFMAFATIVIAWQGIRMMFAHDAPGGLLHHLDDRGRGFLAARCCHQLGWRRRHHRPQ